MADVQERIMDMSRGVGKLLRRQQEWHQAEENRKILTWLSQMSFEDKQRDILSKRHPRTGEWFLEFDEFQKWRDSDPDTPSILWCPGIRKYYAPSSHIF
jgi:hypothetical protein